MWNTILLCKRFYLLVLFNSSAIFQPQFPCYVPVVIVLALHCHSDLRSYTKEINFYVSTIFLQKREQSIYVLCTKLHDTLAYTAGKNEVIWFRPTVGETCPCKSVQHGATVTVSTYLNTFVCSAVVGRVCQCKKSAKYACSVTRALVEVPSINLHEKSVKWEASRFMRRADMP